MYVCWHAHHTMCQMETSVHLVLKIVSVANWMADVLNVILDYSYLNKDTAMILNAHSLRNLTLLLPVLYVILHVKHVLIIQINVQVVLMAIIT